MTKVPYKKILRKSSNRSGSNAAFWDEIAHQVRTQAVPRLITGTKPPKPALPTPTIPVGHEFERQAISGGLDDGGLGTRNAVAHPPLSSPAVPFPLVSFTALPRQPRRSLVSS